MRQPFGRPLTLLTTVAVMALTAMTWMAVDPQSTVRAMPRQSPQSTATRAAVVAGCLSSILRRLSQRADEGELRRPLAREHRSRRRFQPRRNAREGRPQAAQGADAAARPSASRCRHARGVRRLARDRARRARAPAAEPGTRRVAPVEPRGVRQRRPRPDRPRGERHGAAAERHGRVRVRQQRRRPVDHAGADGSLHHRRPPRSAASRWRQPGQPRGDDPLQDRDRHAAGPAHGRGDAVRLVRRPRRQAHVPARRRVCVPAAPDARPGRPHQRHHGRARHRAARRPGAREALHDRRRVQGARSGTAHRRAGRRRARGRRCTSTTSARTMR